MRSTKDAVLTYHWPQNCSNYCLYKQAILIPGFKVFWTELSAKLHKIIKTIFLTSVWPRKYIGSGKEPLFWLNPCLQLIFQSSFSNFMRLGAEFTTNLKVDKNVFQYSCSFCFFYYFDHSLTYQMCSLVGQSWHFLEIKSLEWWKCFAYPDSEDWFLVIFVFGQMSTPLPFCHFDRYNNLSPWQTNRRNTQYFSSPISIHRWLENSISLTIDLSMPRFPLP